MSYLDDHLPAEVGGMNSSAYQGRYVRCACQAGTRAYFPADDYTRHIADLTLRDAAMRVVREAELLPPPSGEHPAVAWLMRKSREVAPSTTSTTGRP